MKIAIIHDWLTGLRGGEKVLLCLLELFPDADLFTIVHKKNSLPAAIESKKITASFIDRLPFAQEKYQYYLPLMPLAVEQFDLSGYDAVISVSHCVAKGVLSRFDVPHISYVNSPMRYAYEFFSDYFGKKGLYRSLVSIPMNYLRLWDVSSANRVDYFVANSNNIKKRIRKHYRRDSYVIYPPVDLDSFTVSAKKDNYYFMLSAFVEYKRLDLAIEAFNDLGFPLVIAGGGAQEKRLKKMAKSNIEFVGDLPREKAAEYYRNARAFVFPGEEDFGITPVEALASGTPVIAYGRGGALETVIGKNYGHIENAKDARLLTGILFDRQEKDSLAEAVKKFETLREEFNPDFLRSSVLKFHRDNFILSFKNYFDFCMKEFKGGAIC